MDDKNNVEQEIHLKPLKCPYCKQPMNLIDGYLTLSHWLCEKCKKEYEFDGIIERIVGEYLGRF